MTYTETLEYLFSRLPMFSRTGAAAIKPDLTNTYKICEWLDNPQQKIRMVHIAGTNGKGSCSHMLASIFQQCGYTTGLYTSPHLKDFRERIRVNGMMIEEEFIIRFTAGITPLIEMINPSFFEITVGMAFEYFAQKEVDIAIIETGLGGRLDSTNVIVPELSVITNIGMDHMNLLGDTIERIASEKAGIIKKNIPVVIGEHFYETEEVFNTVAARNNAPIFYADKIRYAADWKHEHGLLLTDIVNEHDGSRNKYILDLPGYYQLKNLVTVCEAVHQLRQLGFSLPEPGVVQGLRQVRKLTGLHGRWETIQHHPDVVLDVAHNEDGFRQLLKQLELSDHHELHIVLGVVKDKEVERVLSLLPKEAAYYFTQAQIPRALDAELLRQKAQLHGLEGHAFPEVNTALKAALDRAGKKDLVLVCGSVFTVGEVSEVHT